MSAKPEFEGWAILELMGHRRLAGYVREVTVAGEGTLRIDVPTEPPATQYYGGKALFSLTPTTEEIATRIARAAHPVHQLSAGASTFDDDDDGDDGDDEADEPANDAPEYWSDAGEPDKDAL